MKRKIIMFIVSIILFVGLSSCDSLVYTTTPVYYDTYTPTTIVVRQTPPPPPYWGYSVNHRVHKHHKHVQNNKQHKGKKMKSIMEMMNDSNCSLKQFIYEAKGVYTVNTKDISDLLQKDENFDKSSVFDRSNKTAYLLIYNFDGSKFKKYELQNKPVHNWTLFYTTDDDQQVPKKYFFNPGFLSVGEDTKYPHVSLIKVTKSSKIVILIPSESNEPVIDKIVKDNIDLFTDKGQPNTDITKEDIQIVKDWFEKNVKTYQVIENKGNINIYFPDRDTLKSNELNRVGLNNIPHITISRPPRLKGGFAITLYKSGNWAASEFPNPSKAFNEDGTPKYSNINVVLEVFERNIINGKWKDRLNIELK